ncbi:MAG TPA: hypothetical protein VFC50_03975 [Candidatus Dormibacteraeota bacterium]|nr:hypothetical protein [Candidatus Dormibacteraeota bacterium]
MLVSSFFSWWYGSGWRHVINSFRPRLHQVADAFSARQLLRTLFAPWRRIITYPGASIAERFHAWGDNVFSRLVGFVVRFFVLVAALIVLVIVASFTILEIVAWPLLPLAIPGCLIAGLII